MWLFVKRRSAVVESAVFGRVDIINSDGFTISMRPKRRQRRPSPFLNPDEPSPAVSKRRQKDLDQTLWFRQQHTACHDPFVSLLMPQS